MERLPMTIFWPSRKKKKQPNKQKNINFCFIDYAKAVDCVDHNKLWKILRQMGIPDHLTCLLINLYGGQEATFRTGHGARDWFQIGKRVRQSCIMSPCLFNLYTEFSSAQFTSFQLLSSFWFFVIPWIAAHQASLFITISQSSLRLMSIESMMSSSHLILGHPLLLLPPIPPTIRVFSNESTLRMRWPKYWSFSLSIIPSKEIPGLISFRMDWLDLLAEQGNLKSLLQRHNSKASVLQCSAFFTVNSHIHTWPLEKP